MPETNLPIFGAVEDLLLGIFVPYFEGTDVTVRAEYHQDMPLPAVVPLHARRSGSVGFQTSDQAFTEPFMLELNTICEGVEADRHNAELQEACRHALFKAHREQIVVPGVGVINRIQASTKATRQSDWATSTGVVQYQTLPLGAQRYEAIYRLLMRPDPSAVNSNRYLTPSE